MSTVSPAVSGSSSAASFHLPRWVRAVWPWLAAGTSGGLLTLAFPLWNQSWLCWLALVPLVAAVWPARQAVAGGDGGGEGAAAVPGPKRGMFRRIWSSPGVRAAALGYVAGLVFFWTVFSWLTTVTAPGWFALAWYLAFYFAFWAWVIARLAAFFDARLGDEPNRTVEAEAQPAAVAAPGREPRGEHGRTGSPPARPLFGDGLLSWRGLTPRPLVRNWVLRSRWNLLFAALGAAAWVAQEWVRGWLFSGFGWNELGAALHGNVALIQIVEYTGVGGLSFLAAFVNLIAALTVRRFALEMRHGRVRPHFDLTLTMAVLLGVFAYGFAQLPHSGGSAVTLPAAPDRQLKVACVQAAIPQAQKWDPDYEQHIFGVYRRLTEIALAARPQLLVWPEAATPQGVLGERANFEFVMSFVERGSFNFLLGSVDRVAAADAATTPASQASAHDFNAAMLFAPGDPEPQLYYKLHLVPFGEFVPFRNEFPLFAWIVGDQVPSDFQAGRRPVVFETRNPAVRVAPLICFEDTLGELVRRFVLPQPDGKPGAQLLVDLTNDAWFQRSAGSRQHLAEAVFRTVETRRPMVRCANTGVTCVIDAFGRVPADQVLRSAEDDTFGPGVLVRVVEVPPADAPLTFYVRHGDLFAEVCAGITVALVLGGLLLARRDRKTVPPAGRETRRAPAGADALAVR